MPCAAHTSPSLCRQFLTPQAHLSRSPYTALSPRSAMPCVHTSSIPWKGMRGRQADLLLSQGLAVVPDKLPVHALTSVDERAAPAVQAQVDTAGAAVLAGLRTARPQEQEAPAVALQRLSHAVLPPGVLLGSFCYGMPCCGLFRAACSLAAGWGLLPEGRLPMSRWRGKPRPLRCMAALVVTGRHAVRAGCLLGWIATGGSAAAVKAHAAVRVPWPGERCALEAFYCSAELRAPSQGYRPPWATCSAGRAPGPCCGAHHA